MSYYKSLLEKKRGWTPITPTVSQVVHGAENTLGRGLALRVLEIPVGDFITAATKRDLPDDSFVLDLLKSNISDEEKHDAALQNAENAYKLAVPYESEALRIRDSIISFPEHPVLKALVLERSIFFVLLPIMRFLGNPALRTIASDISLDETIHVASHSLICSELNIQLTKRLDRFRKEVVAWLVEDLNIQDNKFGDKDFWIRQSDKLLYEGQSDELKDTSAARMPAFFETNNNNLPSYY